MLKTDQPTTVRQIHLSVKCLRRKLEDTCQQPSNLLGSFHSLWFVPFAVRSFFSTGVQNARLAFRRLSCASRTFIWLFKRVAGILPYARFLGYGEGILVTNDYKFYIAGRMRS